MIKKKTTAAAAVKAAKAKPKKINNGHDKKNGASKDPTIVAEFLGQHSASTVVMPKPPSYRSLKNQLGCEVAQFRDYLLSKYANYHGHDMRKDVAWFMEQYGNGILSEIEKEKRAERNEIIAKNRAQEEAAAAQQEVAQK